MLGHQRATPSLSGVIRLHSGLRRSTVLVSRAQTSSRPTQHHSANGSQSANLLHRSSSGSQDYSNSHSWASEEEEAQAGLASLIRQQPTPGRRRTELGTQGAAVQPATGAKVGQRSLHQPYSRLLSCESKFSTKPLVSSQLCTDLADLHSLGSCAVQVSVEVHPLGWDASEDCRAYILQQHQDQRQHQQQADVQQQQQQQQPLQKQQAGSSHRYRPFKATLKQIAGQVYIAALTHEGQLQGYFHHSNPHTLVLQERVSGAASPPHFRLHIQPGSPTHPGNSYSQAISRAGQGKGLQVFPGSVAGVTEACAVHCNGCGQVKLTIPGVLVCSQLPAAASYPLSITLTALEQQAGTAVTHRLLGQWEEGAKLYLDSLGSTVLWCHSSHPLAAYVGRRIAKLGLTPHQDSYRLTVTLEPPQSAACCAAAAGVLQPGAAAAAYCSAASAMKDAELDPKAAAAAGLDIPTTVQPAAALPAATGPGLAAPTASQPLPAAAAASATEVTTLAGHTAVAAAGGDSTGVGGVPPEGEGVTAQPPAAGAAARTGEAQPESPNLLPADLQLPPASSAAAMEQQLTRLMALGLRPLLTPQQYSSLMEGLQEAFRPYWQAAAAAGADPAPAGAVRLEQLQVLYLYVQAAVDGRKVCRVVAAVERLVDAGAPGQLT